MPAGPWTASFWMCCVYGSSLVPCKSAYRPRYSSRRYGCGWIFSKLLTSSRSTYTASSASSIHAVELAQRLFVVVLADTCVVSVVPRVHAAESGCDRRRGRRTSTRPDADSGRIRRTPRRRSERPPDPHSKPGRSSACDPRAHSTRRPSVCSGRSPRRWRSW